MKKIFISAWGEAAVGGIFSCTLKENGEVVPQSRVPFYHAGYLAWNKDKSRLYATGGWDENTDSVGAFAVAEDGSLIHLNTQKSHGRSCCHLCVSPDDKFVYAANYFTGNFSEYAILEDGSLSEALQKCNGEIFPFGWWHLLKAMFWKKSDTLDMLLIGVRPDYQNKGINALLFKDLFKTYRELGFKYAETNANLETNAKVQAMWTPFEKEQHKKRWVFGKEI